MSQFKEEWAGKKTWDYFIPDRRAQVLHRDGGRCHGVPVGTDSPHVYF